MAYFGLVAHCALQNCGLEVGRTTARTEYPDHNVPSGSGLKKHILNKDLPHLREQFRETHNRFFQLVRTFGFSMEPRNVAFDPTTENWYGEDDSWTIGSNANSNGEVWYFAGLGITATESRFALGLHPVESKSKTTDHMQRFLYFASQHFDLGSVYADAEFYDSDAVETCQSLAGNTWIIRAKNKGDVKRMLQETPKREIGRKQNIDLDGCSIEPNAFAIPTPHRSRSTTQWHTAYLTGHPVHDTDLEELHSDYHERRSIEPLFDQIKNDFHIETSSPERKTRFFYINTAMLYYNFHTLINRVPSPDYKLRFDVASQRVLSAIRDVTIGHYSRL